MITSIAEAGFTFSADMFSPIITLAVQGVGIAVTAGVGLMAISVALDFVIRKFKKIAK